MKRKYTLEKQFLNILCLLFSTYMILDGRSSANVNVFVGNRTYTHVVLFVIVVYLMIVNIIYYFKNGVKFDFINMAILSMTIWILLSSLLNQSDLWTMLVHIGLSMMWLFLYEFMGNLTWNKKTFAILKFWFLLFFTIIIIQFFTAYDGYRQFDNRIPVINLIYYFISMIPCAIFLLDIKHHKYLYVFSSILVLLSSKRGAMIIFPLMILAGYIPIKSKEKPMVKARKIILYSLLFVLLFLMFDKQTNGFLSQRFNLSSLRSGSGRANLFSSALYEFKQRNLVFKIIGTGAGSSIKLLGTGVHNEWLEFLLSYGIIGVIMYIKILLSIFLNVKYVKSKKYLQGYYMMLCLLSLIGLFDGLYFMHSSAYLFLYIGISQSTIISH